MAKGAICSVPSLALIDSVDLAVLLGTRPYSQFLINQQGFEVDFREHSGIHTNSLSAFHYHYWAKQ